MVENMFAPSTFSSLPLGDLWMLLVCYSSMLVGVVIWMTWVWGKHVLCFGRQLPGSDVSDPPTTKPSPCQSPNRTTGNKGRANKTRRSGGAKGPIWSTLCSDKGQRFPDEQCLFRSVQCRCRSGWVEAKWVRLASALITCTVTSPGQHFLAPTPRQQKAKTATTFVTRGEYFLQCHAFSPAQTCIFGGLLWSKFAIVGHWGGATCFGCKFWPQSGTTCISQKFGHTLAPLALA